MASASLSEDLTCSICLTVFTDPVILLCGHSFCRECISLSLDKQQQCPHCRTPVPTEGNYLLTNHILKSLAEKAKEAAKLKKAYRDEKEETEWFCLEHEEKLKLFCITDQQLTCIICRDGERHEKHKFKPVKEAAASVKKDLEMFMQQVSADIKGLEDIANTQRGEMTKTTESCNQLKNHINTQFEEMHTFLRKRQKEINDEMKHKEEDALKKMREKLNGLETALSEDREVEGKVASILEIKETERFLKAWADDGTTKTEKNTFRKKKGNLLKQVEKASISLGPYESHLQFFVWKEMLQVIKPREEKLSLTNGSTSFCVSSDQRSLVFCNKTPCKQVFHSGSRRTSYDYYGNQSYQYETQPYFTESADVFAGQHYWEIHVGELTSWELGIQNNFLKLEGGAYQICEQGSYTTLTFAGRPSRIGVYLNCSSKELSFYDADKMNHIETIRPSSMPSEVSAYFKVSNNNPPHTPLTVCWY